MTAIYWAVFKKMIYSTRKLLENVKNWDKKVISGANSFNYELQITNYK